MSRPRRILLVEDNAITRKLVRFSLEPHHFQVIEAVDGSDALRAVTEQLPDLILLDLILPDCDGIELLSRLRALPGVARVPILAFSGLLSTADEARVGSASFDDMVTKPIEPSRLLQIIEAHLPGEVSDAVSGPGGRLLLVDDDPVQLKLAAFRLKRAGYEVLTAADGLEALELARKARPDAILSDVMMPRLDGFGLAQALRRDSELGRLPLLLVTNTYLEPSDRELAIRLGANDLVMRTPRLGDVLRALTGLLQKPDPPAADVPLELTDQPRRPEPDRLVELEQERHRLILHQLERQAALNLGLSRRCATLSAELSVLSAISGALTQNLDIEQTLETVLAACFDAGGISRGALYLLGGQGELEARRYFGAIDDGRLLADFVGRPDLLRAIVAGRTAVSLPGRELPAADQELILGRLSAGSVIVVPLVHGEAPLGALALVSSSAELVSEDRRSFALGVAHQIGLALVLARSFAEKTASERAAREQAAMLRSILDSIADPVVVVDAGGRCTLTNPAAAVLGLSDRPVPFEQWPAAYRLLRADDESPLPWQEVPLVRAIRGEAVDQAELLVQAGTPSREALRLSVNARPLRFDGSAVHGAVAVFRDVTVERNTQAQLLVSDRLSSVGMLAAGVAHEINNPLAAVLVNLELAQLQLAEPGGPSGEWTGDLAADLRAAMEAAGRVRQIVKDLKIFSRGAEERPTAVDVHRVLDSTVRMAWTEIRHRAQLVREFESVPAVRASEARLGQVFLNLIINAAQALPEGQADRHQIRLTVRKGPPGKVLVEVTDTGPGMAPEVLRKIFTPFFTTKPAGVGTGLGLSICQRIVTALGGEIVVESEPGRGTTFRVLLRAARGTSGSYEGASEPPPPPARRARILVVDDDEQVRVAVRRMLARHHDVSEAQDGRRALAAIGAGERFDVILCDLMMPVMTGMELHARLTAEAPDQASRIVFMSGAAFTVEAHAFLEQVAAETPWRRLEKPLDLAQVEALVSLAVGS